jgi:hypothetical protein
MEATFQLNADELGSPLIEKIKSLFAHQPIRISVESANGYTVNGVVQNVKQGIKVRELSAFFDGLPHLSSEDADSFANDLATLRREANSEPHRDLWAS